MAAVPFILTQTPGTVRSDYTGHLGFKFTTGANAPTVSALGRFKRAGNSQTHTIRLYKYIGGTNNELIASATVDMSTGNAGEYVYTDITPVTLLANQAYFIYSSEVATTGDEWYSSNTTLDSFTAGIATVNEAGYTDQLPNYSPDAVGAKAFVPPNFKVSGPEVAGPNYPSVGESVSTGEANEVTWTNPANIQDADTDEAQITAATFDSPDPSYWLVGRGFGFSIPENSTIVGILVTVNRRSIIASSGIDLKVRLHDANGALIGDNKADLTTVWPSSLTTKTYGGSSDTWNTGLSDSALLAMVNDADFGVAFQAKANIQNADIGVSYITVTIYYTTQVAYTLTCETTSFALTGTNIALKGAFKLACSAASYSMAGTDIALRLGYKLSVAPGTFTMVGSDATFRLGYRIMPAEGSFTLTGMDAALRRGLKILAGPGAFALTGTDVSLRQGFKIVAEPGAFVLTGADVSLPRTYRLTCTPGTFGVTGTDAALRADRRLPVLPGAFTFTGTDANLIHRIHYTLTAEPGAFAVTGTDVTLKRTYTVGASPGSFALAGTDINLPRTYRITAEPGSFALTGTDVELRQGQAQQPPAVVDADTKHGVQSTNSNSWTTLSYPSNLVSGNLILLFMGIDGAPTVTLPNGFVELAAGNATAVVGRVFGKVSDGTETGNFTASLSASEQGAWRCFRITGWYGGTLAAGDCNGVSAVGTNGISQNPDPASRNPANWDVEAVLWFAAAAVDTSRTLTSVPGGYTDSAPTGGDVSGGATGASLFVAWRTNTAASEDPGTFAVSASDDWAALTVAIRPAVTGYRLTCTPGSFALTGTDAALKAARRVFPAPGSFTLAGTDIALKHGYALLAAPGSFALAGTDAGLRWDARIIAAPGSFAYTGTDGGLRADRRILPAPGAFALTGTDVELIYVPVAGSYTLTAEPGSFALTGTPAALRATHNPLAAEPGAFTLAAPDAVLRAGRRLSVAPGSFALAGADIGLRGTFRLAALPGSFALTGTDALLRYGAGYTLFAESGAFALAGTPALLRAARIFPVEPGAFAFTGTDSVLRLARRLATAAGAFSLTGTDAALRAAFRLAAVPGSFIITGTDAVLRFGAGYTLSAEPGSFLLTGTEAALEYARRFETASASFALSGTDARLIAARILGAEPGGFILVGQDVVLAVLTSLPSPIVGPTETRETMPAGFEVRRRNDAGVKGAPGATGVRKR